MRNNRIGVSRISNKPLKVSLINMDFSEPHDILDQQ